MKRIFLLMTTAILVASLAFSSCEKPDDPIRTDDPIVNPDQPNQPDMSFPEMEVSQEQQKRNAILEEFTGDHCGYCPLGHSYANNLMTTYPGQVICINIHQGYFAQNYLTEWGDALAEMVGVTSYPSGCVNRHIFSGAMVQDYSKWATRVGYILGRNSCVNIAAQAVIDTVNRKMAVQVKGFYTAKSDSATNRLNVVLLQNEVVGYQSNYGNYNPSQIDENGNYHHQHMLRTMITGQWGDVIEDTKKNATFDKVYFYDIPAQYGADLAEIKNLEVVAFVALGQSEIMTGVKANIIYR